MPSIEKPLRQLAGVEYMQMDLETGKVQVKFDANNRPTEQQMRAAMKASGFTLDKLEMP